MTGSVDVAAAYQDFTQQMSELTHMMVSAVTAAGQALRVGIAGGMTLTQEVTRSSYHLLGQYTLPIEEELFQDPVSTPPQSLADFNKTGLAVLCLPVIAPVVLSSITWIPLLGNGLTSFAKSFKNVINLSMVDFPTDEKLHFSSVLGVDVEKDPRNTLRLFYGLPGDLVGVVLALPIAAVIAGCRVVSNNLKSFAETWAELVNRALDKKDQLSFSGILNEDRHAIKKYAIGSVGAVLGLIAGSLSALLILFVRGVWDVSKNTLKSFAYAYTSVANLGRAKEAQVVADDKRSKWEQYGIGVFGITTGAVAGGVAALMMLVARGTWWTLSHNGQSFGHAFQAMANVGRARDAQVEMEKDKRSAWQQYGVGIAGLVTGAVVGGLAALIILAARGTLAFISHSWQSFAYALVNTANIGRAKDNQVVWGDDRSKWQQYGIGIAGIVTGAVMGSVAALVMLVARGTLAFIDHTMKSFVFAFAKMANFGIVKDNQIAVKDDRSKWKQYGVGIVGIATGAVTGGLAAVVILAGRGAFAFIEHTFQSFEYAFKNVANLGRAKDSQVAVNDDRNKWKRYGAGFVGVATGAAAGGVAAVIILVTRGMLATLHHTAQSFHYAYHHLANLGRAVNTQVAVTDDRGGLQRYGFGVMGIVTGIAAGSLAALVNVVMRALSEVIHHSAHSFMFTYTTVSNLGRSRASQKLAHDARTKLQCYGLGFIGIVMGTVVGGLSALAIAAVRGSWSVLHHSVQSYVYAYGKMANLGRARDQQASVDDARLVSQLYGIGIAGIVSGAVIGSIAALVILAVRGISAVVTQSVLSFKNTLLRTVNLTLPAHATFDVADDHRLFTQKYLLGGSGILLGVTLGGVAALSVLVARATWSVGSNTYTSWQALSGSLINGAVNRQWHEGLGGDTRSGIDKSIGVLGYTSAVAFTAPLALGIVAAKWTPVTLGILASLSLSPLVATCKLTAACLEKCCGVGARFHSAESSDAQIQKFKDLYSSLTAGGHFDQGGRIAKGGNGKGSWGFFVVKSLKLNLRSTTENLLNALLQAYKKSGMDSHFFASDAFTRVVSEIKRHHSTGCYDHIDAKRDYDEKIDKLAAFIQSYMSGGDTPVPPDLNTSSHRSSWAATFWGGARRQMPGDGYEQVRGVEGVARPESSLCVNRPSSH